MAGGSSNKKVFDEINITPLTDIFLVLLVIMMVVAPLITFRELDISFSGQEESTQAPKSPEESKLQSLEVKSGGETGEYLLNGKQLAPDELVAALKSGIAEHPEGLTIRADSGSPFAAMATALDAARVAGITQVSVVEAETEPAAPETPAPAEDTKAKADDESKVAAPKKSAAATKKKS